MAWSSRRPSASTGCGKTRPSKCAPVPLGGDLRIGGLDDGAQAQRLLDVDAHVRRALRLVAVEPVRAGELPGEVRRAADAGAHALAEERRRLVRGVAGDEEAPVAPALGDE